MSNTSPDKHFYRTVVEIEVLSEEETDFQSLADIDYAITDGHCSGRWNVTSQLEVAPAQMAELLKRQGSDPSFLGLDDEGNVRCEVCDNPILECQCPQEVACKFVDENTHKCLFNDGGYYQMDCIGSAVCERWEEA